MTQREFMALLEASEEVREMAVVLNHSQRKPAAIRESQRMAFGFLRHSRERFLQASNQFDQAMARAAKAMEETHGWEKQHQAFVREFISLCESQREKWARARMATILRVRRKLGDRFQDQVKREPVLRRMMSKSRSRPPTPISISAAALVSRPPP